MCYSFKPKDRRCIPFRDRYLVCGREYKSPYVTPDKYRMNEEENRRGEEEEKGREEEKRKSIV